MDVISVTKFLSEFSEYRDLTKSFPWYTEIVGPSFDYDVTVHQYKRYAYHGVVMELFIRKYLCQLFNVPCKDDRTEKFLNSPEFEDCEIQLYILDAYEHYENPYCNAIDIFDFIKTLALSHPLAHNNCLEYLQEAHDMVVNECNLEKIMHFLNNLEFKKIICKEFCKIPFGEYILVGVPHFIFDNNVFCQIATSMSNNAHKRKLPQMIFYILGHYGRYYLHKKITWNYQIIIYNPLKGLKYTTYFNVTPAYFKNMVTRIENDIHFMVNDY